MPNGGLLNTNLGLGTLCAGVVVIGADNIAQLCVQQNGDCCCSAGLPPSPHPTHHIT